MKGKEIEKKLKNEVGPMAKKSYQVQSQICLFKNENDEPQSIRKIMSDRKLALHRYIDPYKT